MVCIEQGETCSLHGMCDDGNFATGTCECIRKPGSTPITYIYL